MSGTVACANETFDPPDPAQFFVKGCFIHRNSPEVAVEGQSFNAALDFYQYGSGLNGNYLLRSLSGVVTCSNATFGGDPDPGTPKVCLKGLR